MAVVRADPGRAGSLVGRVRTALGQASDADRRRRGRTLALRTQARKLERASSPRPPTLKDRVPGRSPAPRLAKERVR